MEMGCSLNFRSNMIYSGINVKKKLVIAVCYGKTDIWALMVYGKYDDRLFLFSNVCEGVRFIGTSKTVIMKKILIVENW